MSINDGCNRKGLTIEVGLSLPAELSGGASQAKLHSLQFGSEYIDSKLEEWSVI